MNKEFNQALANEIRDFLLKNEVFTDTRIYFNNMAYSIKYTNYETIENINAFDYVEYGSDDILIMVFEGTLYSMINHHEIPSLLIEFDEIFERHGVYYELGHAFSLSVYK
ncbi:hypothetical protein [Gottfriedia solisilvae]|uniref:hypothetical protein n=1 Tax=Gottfriedia solisilvae TaxID=1516104 RepID=UPI003D2EA0A1